MRADLLHQLILASVERLGNAKQSSEPEYGAPAPLAQAAVAVVLLLGPLLPVIARDQGHHFDFLAREPAQVAVLDDVIGMLGVLLVTDARTDIVNERGVVQEPARILVQTVLLDQIIVEGEGEIAHVTRMHGIAAEAIEQSEDAA